MTIAGKNKYFTFTIASTTKRREANSQSHWEMGTLAAVVDSMAHVNEKKTSLLKYFTVCINHYIIPTIKKPKWC